MELYLLRHGIPVDPENWDGTDSRRPLTPAGERQTREVLDAFVALLGKTPGGGALPIEIWSSPYVRTEQTARIAAAALYASLSAAASSGANPTGSARPPSTPSQSAAPPRPPAIPVRLTPALASGAAVARTLPAAQGDPAHWPEALLLVGHMPDLGHLVSVLTGDRSGHHSFGRAGMAHLSGAFSPGGMRLHWLRAAEELLQNGA